MSSIDDVLTILFSCSAEYRRLRKLICRGSESSLRSTLCRLRANGLAEKQGDVWVITPKGVGEYEDRQAMRKRSELMGLNRGKKKTMIVAFDVPEYKRILRDWLREELLVLGFEPIQKSVWFGPGPLPEMFIQELDERGILPCLKFFKAREEDIV